MTAVCDKLGAEATFCGMGTVISNKVYGRRAPAALRAAEAETVRLEKLLSRYLPESDIGRLNSRAGKEAVKVSLETFEVLSYAHEYSDISRGAFDLTVGSLVDVWRIRAQASVPPDKQEIEKALPLVDYSALILNDGNKAGLKKTGQSVDLGGIAKGYAADKIVQVFKRYGIMSAYTNFGGNVAVIGTKPDGAHWQIGIRHPRRDGGIVGVIPAADQSVVTSGDYQRCFIGPDKKRYHHILDPNTGYPADKGLISVTVIADSSMAADALSTVVFTLGMARGIDILRQFPGTEAVLIDSNMTIHITRGLKGRFQTMEESNLKIIN